MVFLPGLDKHVYIRFYDAQPCLYNPCSLPDEPAKLIPSRELEEKRKAYVRPEANYTMKISLCGSLTSRKKKKGIFRSKTNTEFDKAELSLYEEVTLMKPFRRKTLVLIGASGSSRRSLKHRILNQDPDQV